MNEITILLKIMFFVPAAGAVVFGLGFALWLTYFVIEPRFSVDKT
ncbi:hypothetical protein [Jeotgalibacillus terrae]|uniref:Uncharacterized protein n=1 Tax=Jeotgalibacillus terrae TaxID=587735 RepID=A0ABW5ZHV2_9BACL|nr:hypothetical protein [Jeotgalibacillus terrae]MBM7581137.1 hypothetical protein [Jeotgalibacillus terrae]